MHALILAATLVATPQNPGQATRDIVVGVCLPFVATGEASADNIALADLKPQPGDEQAFQTGDGRHLVELSTRGDAEEGTLRRTCTVQARAGGFEQARDAVAGPLQRAGFTPSPDEPEDWPVWTRPGGQTATIHQNPGRATIVRVSYSMLDEEPL